MGEIITEAALAAKQAAGLSFAGIATHMGCTEEDVGRIFFRDKAAASYQVTSLAAVLMQPAGSFDGFLSMPRPKSSFLVDFGKSALDKVVVGAVAALVIFFVQQDYLRRSEAIQRAIALANIRSETLRNEATKFVESFHTYLDGAVEFQEQRATAPNDQSTRDKMRALQGTYRIVRSSMDIIESVAAQPIEHKAEFTTSLDDLNDSIQVIGANTDINRPLEGTLASYAKILFSVQRITRSAVMQEYKAKD